MRTYTINGNSVQVVKNTFSYSDTLNERTTCSFQLADPVIEVDIGMEVRISEDGDEIFAGTIEDISETGDVVKYVTISCVDFSQLIDKRIVFDTFEQKTAGFIARSLMNQFFTVEGITEGNIQDGPMIEKAVFNYDNGNVAMNYIQDVTGLNWDINGQKQLNLYDRASYTAPFELTDTSLNYHQLQVKRNRGQYRNKQYIRAGKDITQEIPKEVPTPKPDGASRTFIVRLPIAKKPRIFIDDVEVNSSDIGVQGIDSGKKFYFSYNSNAITQDFEQPVLEDVNTITITYQGLFPIVVMADNPDEIAERNAIEGGSGIYEHVSDESNVDSRDAAFQIAFGKLDKYGLIQSVVKFNTHVRGLKAGQLISIKNAKLGLDDNFLIESVAGRVQNGYLNYTVKCLDGTAIGGWEQFFKSLIGGQKKYVIRENEVLVFLNNTQEKVGWNEQTEDTIFACEVPSETLYPSETFYPC